MANIRAQRIAAPMIRQGRGSIQIQPAIVQHALLQACVHRVVAREWANIARRSVGGISTETERGNDYRAWQADLRRTKRRGFVAKSVVKSPSRLQWIARRIARMFRKH